MVTLTQYPYQYKTISHYIAANRLLINAEKTHLIVMGTNVGAPSYVQKLVCTTTCLYKAHIYLKRAASHFNHFKHSLFVASS